MNANCTFLFDHFCTKHSDNNKHKEYEEGLPHNKMILMNFKKIIYDSL